MKIIQQPVTVAIEQVGWGKVFKIDNTNCSIFMKVQDNGGNEGTYRYNAVNLANGEVCMLLSDTRVRVLDTDCTIRSTL